MIQSPGRITYIRASPCHHTASATAGIRSPWCSRPPLSAPPPSTALPGLPDRRERDQPRRHGRLAEVAPHDQQVVPGDGKDSCAILTQGPLYLGVTAVAEP